MKLAVYFKHSILDKCFKNEKYSNNKFLLNSISLIINKFFYNLNLILNNNNKSNNKSIIELLFSIFETRNFLNLCFKIVLEEENCTSKENEIETGLVSPADTSPIIVINFNLLSNFEEILNHQADCKIRLRLFSFLSYLAVIKYNYLNDDFLLKKLIKEFKKIYKIKNIDYQFGLTIKILFYKFFKV